MHRAARSAALAALSALALGGCGTFGGDGETFSDLREFFGASDPMRHARRLDSHHDRESYRHAPDTPPTWDACFEEIGVLAASHYANRREIASAVFVLTRVATEDPGALHRAEAVRALRAVAAPMIAAEDPPAVPGAESEVSAAVTRLPELHATKDGIHLGAEAREECAALLRVIGDLRVPPVSAADPRAARKPLRDLRGALLAVLGETRSDLAHREADIRGPADRALANLCAQATLRVFGIAALHDPDARVRGDAYDALGAVRPEIGLPILAAAFRRERTAAARARLVEAVCVASAEAGDGRAAGVPVLIAALDDPTSTVRFLARRGLTAMAGEDLGEARGPWVRWWNREKPGP